MSNTFNQCCSKCNKVTYNIQHNPKPLNFIPELRQVIDDLLWYAPGISSIQAKDNQIIDNKLYSEPIFDKVLKVIQLSRDIDVKIIDEKYNNSKGISNQDVRFYQDKLCINCQKIILTRTNKNETLLRCMLRHIRNSIAHGNFIPIENLVVFIDTNKVKNNWITTAIIKIDIMTLNKFLILIKKPEEIIKMKIISNKFDKLGFQVQEDINLEDINTNNASFMVKEKHMLYDASFDIILKKDKKIYIVKTKKTSKKRIGYLDPLIDDLIQVSSHIKSKQVIPIFIYDDIIVSNKAKERLKSQDVILLDKKT